MEKPRLIKIKKEKQVDIDNTERSITNSTNINEPPRLIKLNKIITKEVQQNETNDELKSKTDFKNKLQRLASKGKEEKTKGTTILDKIKINYGNTLPKKNERSANIDVLKLLEVRKKEDKTTNTVKVSDQRNNEEKELFVNRTEGYNLVEPSEEQQIILNEIGDEKNVVVDAVAGSGKTTTILHISKKYKEKDILLLTYNSKLKLETREKTKKLKIENMEVHSYHSFGYKYYTKKCQTDHGIIELLEKSIEPIDDFTYDLIILDEVQDMNSLYYRFVLKVIRDNRKYKQGKKYPQLCIIGDRYQSIYNFNESDNRFLIHADKIFPTDQITSRQWSYKELSISFRVTDQIALFVNRCVLGMDRLKTIKSASQCRYVICNVFSYSVFDEVKRYLHKYEPEEIFILTPSIRSMKSPVRMLANMLSDKGYPIYVPNSDEEKLDDDILKGKIIVSTYHQVKGLERKAVIVFSFDQSYFDHYAKDQSPFVCPNPIYVALTRALESMMLIHHYQHDFLPFLNRHSLRDYTNYIVIDPLSIQRDRSGSRSISVNDLTRHLSSNILNKCLSYIDLENLTTPDEFIDIPSKVTSNNSTYENVTDINNVAILSYFELQTTKTLTIYTKLNQSPFKNTKITIPELLELSNRFISSITGYKFKVSQIQKYDWLTESDMSKCIDRLLSILSDDTKFQLDVSLNISNFEIDGIIDCIDFEMDTLWQFRCVDKLKPEHFIQLAIYSYISKCTNTASTIDSFKIFNIFTNELYELKYNQENTMKMLDLILDTKFSPKTYMTDEEFIEVHRDFWCKPDRALPIKKNSPKQKRLIKINET